MNKFLPFIISLTVIISVNAQNPNLGTGGAQFLEIPVGARAESMAGAVVGYLTMRLLFFGILLGWLR